ncbi:hypothetical protein BD309DRAFT_954489 [Dichomitus squalens]|nr:hypothetical protein BD309DRAFT_954489 [Dichomitus squalens]
MNLRPRTGEAWSEGKLGSMRSQHGEMDARRFPVVMMFLRVPVLSRWGAPMRCVVWHQIVFCALVFTLRQAVEDARPSQAELHWPWGSRASCACALRLYLGTPPTNSASAP